MLQIVPELLWSLLREHGSPLIVGSRSIVLRQLQRLRASLPAIDWHFAVKANCDSEILQTLSMNKCGFDVASYAELEKVTKAFAGSESQERRMDEALDRCTPFENPSESYSPRILHSHPCKSPVDIDACYQAGQRRFVIDCENELDKLASIAPQSRLMIRLNVFHRSGQVAFSHRFGADLDAVVSLATRSQSLGLPIDGIAFHVGSQAIDPSDFDAALNTARRAWDLLRASHIELTVLDIGGGFPVSYRDQPAPLLEAYCHCIGKSIQANFGDLAVSIVAEPGRVLCAEAVSLIATVIGKQRRQGKLWYTIDDGRYGSFSGRYFTEDTFDFFPYQKPPCEVIRARKSLSSSLEPSMIAGPSCDGADIVAGNYLLPDLEVGDVLVVPNMGAYSAVSASEFNGMRKAKHIWLS